MNKSIRLLVESFFDDEIFDVEDNIKTDIEDLGRYYYDYQIGEIFYQNKKPYAVCCGESKLFIDNNSRFCLLNDLGNSLKWRTVDKLVKELKSSFIYYEFLLNSINDFNYIDEDGYKNTLIIKNNYNINEFPAFEKCIELGNNVYLPAIDELLVMYLNKDKLSKYIFIGYIYWSSTLNSAEYAYLINLTNTARCYVDVGLGTNKFRVRPFFHLE